MRLKVANEKWTGDKRKGGEIERMTVKI